MPVIRVVQPQDLGTEFLIGPPADPTHIILNLGTNLAKDPITGKINAIIPPAGATTNALTTTGASLTSTVNTIGSTVDLTSLVRAAETNCSLTYNGTTGALTFTNEDGVANVINLPLEQFLSAASFNSATNVLTLTLNNGTTVPVNLAALIDLYTLTGSNSVTITGNGSTATPWVASVKVDPVAGNAITASAAGLKVTLPAVTNTLSNPVNTITSVVGGISATAPAVNTVALTGVPVGTLTSTVNGVASTALPLGPVIRPLADIQFTNAFGTTTLGYGFSTNV